MLTLIARPIDTWPGQLTPESRRKDSPFTADWSDTVAVLEREVEHLAGRDAEIVLQLAITERDCRNDGWIRSDARPAHPGVIVSFTDQFTGRPMRISTDHFRSCSYGLSKYLPGWKANVRAVALGLEALRKVDRYGIGSGHEQYVGWQQLGSGEPMAMDAGMTLEQAAAILIDACPNGPARCTMPAEVIANAEVRQVVYRAAAKATHPDTGGSEEAFKLVTSAHQLLEEHG